MVYESTSNTLIKNIWDWDIIDISKDIHNILQTYTKINIIFNCIGEHEIHSLININLDELDTVLSKTNSKLYFIFGTYGEYLKKYKNITFIEVPTFFLTTNEFPHHIQEKNQNYFFSLINRPHEHRCFFIDNIFKKNLQKYLNFSWNIKTKHYLDTQYEFKYWKEEIVNFNDGYVPGNDYILPPNDYLKTSFDLVLESTSNKIFYTEKTKRPIHYKKPFLIIGAKNINRRLEDFGFKLFDEIIDYKFDTYNSYEDRVESLIEQLSILTIYDIDYIHDRTRPTVNYNFDNLQNLTKYDYFSQNLKDKLSFVNTKKLTNKINNTIQLIDLIKNE